MATSIDLRYGEQHLLVELPSDTVTVFRHPRVAGLADEHAAFVSAVRTPIGTPPLSVVIQPGDTVAVGIPDITRWLPLDRLLLWLFEELPGVRPEDVVIVNGTGSHRENTPEELARMMGPEVARCFRIINHRARDLSTLTVVGHMPSGQPLSANKDFLHAKRRIVLGFIEPHFMAGWSGGYKGCFPAFGGLDCIVEYHGADIIGHPNSTWLKLEGNPTQECIRHCGRQIGIDFLVNVTLNPERQLTGFFCGDPIAAHETGCAAARPSMTVPCARRFPVVITTNRGYPADLNLYQAVKGMTAAADIVESGGLIIAAAECRDGFPDHGNFKQLLFTYPTPDAFLAALHGPGFPVFDQWEVQMLAKVRERARVALKSALPPSDVSRAWLTPIDDVAACVDAELKRIGRTAPIAVIPGGFDVVPYLAE